MSVSVEKLFTNERKLREMANGSSSRSQRLKEFIDTTGGFLASIVIIGGAIVYVVVNLTTHGINLEDLDEKIDNIENEYDEIYTKMESFVELAEEDHEILVNLAASSKTETVYNIEVLSNSFGRTEIINNEEFLSAPSLDTSHIFAKDWDSDITYTVGDLYNSPIITSYKEGEDDVYFYGRYDEDGKWNGTCILNTYNGDNLISIFEGLYQNGYLFRYKRVSIGEDGEWVITDRINQEDYNIGKTWKYTKNTEFVKSFNAESMKDKQIMTVDKFLQTINEKMISYYKGNTSNGLYNDSTGNAYLIKYKTDGNVDYLYAGKMKDGYPNDSTGNAWSVSWGHANDGYYYYKGIFTNGQHGKPPKKWKPMTPEEINEIVNPDDFEYPLTGLID